MTANEIELENRLNELPDVYPGFVRASLHGIKQCGLVSEVLDLLDEHPDATTDSVLVYESLRCGLVDRYAEDGARVPVPCEWLSLTSGMRGILADMKAKMLKSYQLALAGADGTLADRYVRLNLGQHAVDLNCCDFTFDVDGLSVDLGAMRSEKMSLRDDFGADPDLPVHAYSVGERVTGVDLLTDHVGLGDFEFDVDVAVIVKTAHGAYTFARESWESTAIVVCKGDGADALETANARNAEWLESHPDLSAATVKHSIAKLA